MSKNVTYLLGAGASYHSIPIVNTMNERMLMFLDLINEFKAVLSDNVIFVSGFESLSDIYKPYLTDGFEKYRSVVLEAIKHHTVDTYARKLWLQGKRGELLLLKEFLCLYFAFEQSELDEKLPKSYGDVSQYAQSDEHIRKHLDYRYDVFMATLMNQDMKLPENVSIISWNYDYQLELAYMDYANCEIGGAINQLSIYPGLDVNSENAKIIKLNGSAIQMGYPNLNKNNRNIWTVSDTNNTDSYKLLLEQLLLTKKSIKNEGEFLINFAWENMEYQKKAFQRARDIIADTHELIVIGYSFPNFNKKIDAGLFTGIKRANFSVKVQCPENDYRAIEENIKSLGGYMRNADIRLHRNINQFYIPSYQLID